MKNSYKDNIELHCEEVQEIMGNVPPWILRWGVLAIAFVTMMFFAGCYLFRLPETIDGNAIIAISKNNIIAKMLVVDSKVSNIKIGQEVKISLDRYPSSRYGYIIGFVNSISEIPNRDNEYTIWIRLPHRLVTDANVDIPLKTIQRGKSKIIIGNVRLINRLVMGLDKFDLFREKRNIDRSKSTLYVSKGSKDKYMSAP